MPSATARPLPAVPLTATRLTDRQEAFCQAMACNTGGAEASRRAGYSPNGAKQRGAYLMNQPEIRIRIDQLRAERRADHRAALEEAEEQVREIIADALESNRTSLALRAIEFGLKLRGVIQDKRIAYHYHLDRQHPDADLEDLAPDPEEELDAIAAPPPVQAIQPPAQPAAKISAPTSGPVPEPAIAIVTRNDDHSQAGMSPADTRAIIGQKEGKMAEGAGRGSNILLWRVRVLVSRDEPPLREARWMNVFVIHPQQQITHICQSFGNAATLP